MRKNFLFLLGVCCLMIFPVFSFAEELGDTKSFLNPFIELLPGALKQSWQDALEFWQKLLYKMKGIGEKILKGRIGNVLTFLKKEILKRKSIFKQELQKEIRELKDEISKLFQKIFKR